MRLILASASPRRADLLAAAGFRFEVLPVEIDERPRPDEPPEVYVRRLAAEKAARAVDLTLLRRPGLEDWTVVLAADTTVTIDGRVLGKPEDAADAHRMLRQLSGRRHEVLTGISLREVALADRRPRSLDHVESTAVYFAELRDQEIDWYVQSSEGRDKAGGYAIQGLASRFVRRIEGSYSNVVGLPVAAVHELLNQIRPGLALGLEVSG